MGEALSQDLNRFAKFIEDKLGIVYAEANMYQLEHRLKDLAQRNGVASLDELWQKMERDITRELQASLLDLATNNETSFFRDRMIFKTLEDLIVPNFLKDNASAKNFRVWSAASSTGQEGYSIAMVLQAVSEGKPFVPFEILATDFSERALGRAKSGEYSQLEVQRGLPAPLLMKYFDKIREDGWQVKDVLRQKFQFQRFNLLDDPQRLGDFDLIFLRNVLIYQNVQNKKDIVNRITSRLKMGGYLVLGAAESLLGLSNRYEQVYHDKTVIYRRKE